MGCLLMPFTLIGRGLKWCFTNGWKGFVVLGAILLLTGVGYCTCQGVATSDRPDLDREPIVQEAPYNVQTVYHYFYANKVGRHGSQITMVRCWEKIGEEWHYSDRITIDSKVVGEIVVSKREASK